MLTNWNADCLCKKSSWNVSEEWPPPYATEPNTPHKGAPSDHFPALHQPNILKRGRSNLLQYLFDCHFFENAQTFWFSILWEKCVLLKILQKSQLLTKSSSWQTRLVNMRIWELRDAVKKNYEILDLVQNGGAAPQPNLSSKKGMDMWLVVGGSEVLTQNIFFTKKYVFLDLWTVSLFYID